MSKISDHHSFSLRRLKLSIGYPMVAVSLLAGCITPPPQSVVYVSPPRAPVHVSSVAMLPTPAPFYQQPQYQPSQMVVSVYEDPPIAQPEPILVGWAPPPMLVESPYDMPYPGAVWTGGYWVWNGDWVWAHGRWAGAPRPNYYWVHPYYENRGGNVVFITGYWSPPTAVFVAPFLNANISFASVALGVLAGAAVLGPQGVFVPAPPGSRPGIIVPAPIGTPPAVVTGAQPVINVGMRIRSNVNSNNTTVNGNVTNNVTNNISKVTNITNVTIVAPATATANGQAVNASVPAQAYLAAAMRPVVNALAPKPTSAQPIPAYSNSRALTTLAPAQPVRTGPVPNAASVAPNAALQDKALSRSTASFVAPPTAVPNVVRIAQPAVPTTPVAASGANQLHPVNADKASSSAKNSLPVPPQQAARMAQIARVAPAKPAPSPPPANQAKAKHSPDQQPAKTHVDSPAKAKVDMHARPQTMAASDHGKQHEPKQERPRVN